MLDTKVKPYEFMIFPTVQKAWIEGKGRLLWLGLFFVEFGASLFLVSSIFHCRWGETAGWLITSILGVGCHFLFLGHPFRLYRAIRKPGSAWISRGLIIISLFQLFGFFHLLLSYFSIPAPWLMIVANILAAATVAYGAYELADVKPISVWHCSFLPIQMFARSFFLAFAVMLGIYLLLDVGTIAYEVNVKKWVDIVLLVNVFLFSMYLISLLFEEGKNRLALGMMWGGSLKGIFWPWVAVGGMIIPLFLVIYSLSIGVATTPAGVLLIAVILQCIADPLLRYCMMRSGYYGGLFPSKPVDFRGAS